MVEKFIKAVCMHICVLAMMLTCFMCTSCDSSKSKKSDYRKTQIDSCKVVEIVNDVLEPTFDDFNALDRYRAESFKNKQIEDVFLSMSDQTYKIVSKTCLNRHGTVTVYDICKEYIKNKEVYDNLPSPSSINNGVEVTVVDDSGQDTTIVCPN